MLLRQREEGDGVGGDGRQFERRLQYSLNWG